MRHITEGVYGLVMSRGIANGRAGTRANGGKIARTAGTGAAGIGADDQGEEPGRPLTGLREGGRNPMGMGKTRATKARASFQGGREDISQEPSMARSHPVPRIVVDNSRCMPLRDPTRSAQRGSGIHLTLIVGSAH